METLQHTSEIFKDIQDALIHAFQHLKCLKTLKNEIWDMLTDQLTYRKSDQLGQKMRKNDQNCCLKVMGYLNLHFSTFK